MGGRKCIWERYVKIGEERYEYLCSKDIEMTK
jgi:hypothetical protein